MASVDRASKTRLALKPAADQFTSTISELSPIDRALRTIADCQARYQTIEDYTCTFYKRERIEGRMTPQHIMSMKVRTKPQSIYFKFQQPAQGREAIYIAGRHGGKVLAHDVGLNKLLGRHAPARADFVSGHGGLPASDHRGGHRSPPRHPGETMGRRAESGRIEGDLQRRHGRGPESMHHDRIDPPQPTAASSCTIKVRVFIDQELGLPIRFEAYDWPKRPKAEPELLEEYTYTHLKLNVGLRDIDFDVSNSAVFVRPILSRWPGCGRFLHQSDPCDCRSPLRLVRASRRFLQRRLRPADAIICPARAIVCALIGRFVRGL